MGAGVLFYYGLRVEPPAWLGAKIAAASFGLAIILARRQMARAIALSVAFAALGFASAQYATARAPPIESDLPRRAVIVTGIAREVENLPNGRRVMLSNVMMWPSQISPQGSATRRPPARAPPVSRAGVPVSEPPPGTPSDAQTGAPLAAPLGALPNDPALPDIEPGHALNRLARIRLAKADDGAVETGDTVRVRAMLFAPSPPAIPGAWDTQFDAFFSGLGASGYALGRIEVLTRAPPASAAAWVQHLRETIAARVLAVVPGGPGEVAVTLLTGASRGIPEADHEAFRQSGLAHLLAVAGLHIGIVMGFALAVARTAFALSEHASLFWPTKKLAAAFALCVGAGYLVLTGAHVPIVRSFAMACLFTLAILAGRQPISLRGLGLAGVALMLIEPYEVPGVSFQMSFSAVLALISGYEALRPWLRRLYGHGPVRRLLSYGVALALTSALAGTASLPYGAWHFGHVQTYYVFSNLVAVPVAAFWVMPLGMVALLLMPFGLEFIALVPMGWGTAVLIRIARITAWMPGATLPAPHAPTWGLLVLSFGVAWLGIWRTRLRLAGIAAIVLGLASPLFDRPADILITADAGLIGLRTESGVFLQHTHGSDSFPREAMFTYWSVAEAAPLPVSGTAGDGALNCTADQCSFRPRSETRPALLVRGAAHPSGCADASVLVSAEPARGVCRWPAPPLVDRFTVWRDGAVAIFLGPNGARVVTDRETRGDRPWVPPPPKPRPPPVSDLPNAPLDNAE